MAVPFKRLYCQVAKQSSQHRSSAFRGRRRVLPQQWKPLRAFSSTPARRAEGDNQGEFAVQFNQQLYSQLTPEEQAQYERLTPQERARMEAELQSQLVEDEVADDEGDGAEFEPAQLDGDEELEVMPRPRRQQQLQPKREKRLASFWEMGQGQEIGPDDAVVESDISSQGHAELARHREMREMVRKAAWEMPLLSSLAKPFEPPTEEQVLRWRYTTYLGDTHPASRKVVVSFIPDRLPDLTDAQKLKLKKIAGVRYNPDKEQIKMSCESFETQAQNKRYLGDTIAKLIAEAKDPNADKFEDVPLYTGHVKRKPQFWFPESWKLTPEKRQELEDRRKLLMIEEGQRVENSEIISGIAAIEAARQVNAQKIEQPIMAEARQPLPKGKMGKKEMGQQRVQR